MKITKPMKGPQLIDPETGKFFIAVPYPVLATPKLDGIRCLVVNHKALTDKFEPIPNKWIAYSIAEFCPNGFDGEIITHTNGKRDDFNTTQSKVMSEEGKPSFGYYVFDYVKSTLSTPYAYRMQHLAEVPDVAFVVKILPKSIKNRGELLIYEDAALENGYEGVMLRMPYGPYKCGRSTLKEFGLVKMKRFLDSEAIVISVNERKHNAGKGFKGKIGQTKHHKFKKDLESTGMAGSITCRDCNPESEHYNQVFKCGLRMTAKEKTELFKHRDTVIDDKFTYKYQRSGQKELPRFPVFYRWRL